MVEIVSEKEQDLLAARILDIGEIMLRSGAEVNRVEDTIQRICTAYGSEKVDIFTINNLMVLTLHMPGGRVLSQSRRVTSTATDLEKIGRANELSRCICAEPLSIDELTYRIKDIEERTKHYSLPLKYVAFLLGASSFTVFFGGGWMDAIASAICSLVVCTTVTLGARLKIQPIISTLVSAFIMTGVISGLITIGVGSLFDKIVIGNIMLLIPGLNLTTSIRDIITGDTVSGLMGMCDALLKAFAIAVGCVSVMLLTGLV